MAIWLNCNICNICWSSPSASCLPSEMLSVLLIQLLSSLQRVGTQSKQEKIAGYLSPLAFWSLVKNGPLWTCCSYLASTASASSCTISVATICHLLLCGRRGGQQPELCWCHTKSCFTWPLCSHGLWLIWESNSASQCLCLLNKDKNNKNCIWRLRGINAFIYAQPACGWEINMAIIKIQFEFFLLSFSNLFTGGHLPSLLIKRKLSSYFQDDRELFRDRERQWWKYSSGQCSTSQLQGVHFRVPWLLPEHPHKPWGKEGPRPCSS